MKLSVGKTTTFQSASSRRLELPPSGGRESTKGNQSRNIGGLVDMRSQKLFLTLNKSKKTSEVIGNMNKKLSKVEHLIKTVTFDNGKEFTNHGDLLPKSSRKVYFCNAYSPWQKPLIEKINSMIHRVYSKSADITSV